MKLTFSFLLFLLLNSFGFSNILNFGAPFQINSTASGSSFDQSNYPVVASNDKGEVVAVWQTILPGSTIGNIKGNIYAASRNALGIWTVEQQINASSGGSANIALLPQVALNNNGEAIAIWQSSTNSSGEKQLGDVYVSTRSSNGTWSQEELINSNQGAAEDAFIALNDNNQAVAIWNEPETESGLVVVISKDSSGIWFEEVSIDGDAGKVALNNNGVAVAIGIRKAGILKDKKQMWAAFRNAKGIWTALESISSIQDSIDDSFLSSSVALNSNGLAVATWQTDSDSKTNVFAAIKNPNEPWGQEQQINSGRLNNSSVNPNLSLNDKGEALITWSATASFSTNSNIYISSKTANNTWTPQQQMNFNEDLNLLVFPRVTLNNNSVALLSWLFLKPENERDLGSNLYYSVKTADGSWSEEQILGSSLFIGFLQSQALNNLNQGIFVFSKGFFSILNPVQSNIFGSETIGNTPITQADQLWRVSQTQNSFYPQKTGF